MRGRSSARESAFESFLDRSVSPRRASASKGDSPDVGRQVVSVGRSRTTGRERHSSGTVGPEIAPYPEGDELDPRGSRVSELDRTIAHLVELGTRVEDPFVRRRRQAPRVPVRPGRRAGRTERAAFRGASSYLPALRRPSFDRLPATEIRGSPRHGPTRAFRGTTPLPDHRIVRTPRAFHASRTRLPSARERSSAQV